MERLLEIRGGDESKEAIYEEIRQRLVRKQTPAARERDVFRALRASLDRAGGKLADLLQSRLTLALAGGFSLVLAAASVFLMYGEAWTAAPFPGIGSVGTTEPVSPVETTVRLGEVIEEPAILSYTRGETIPGETVPAGAAPAEADHPALPETAAFAQAPAAREAFVVRVGSFRDPSNAQRVVEALREREPGVTSVRTEALAGGLHAVMVGPFPERATAESAARRVREAVGLAPQVLQLVLP